MADVVNNGNDHAALKPGEAASTNSTAGFSSFAEFEAQMAKEEAGGATGAAQLDAPGDGPRPSSQIADRQAEEAAAAAPAGDDTDEDEDEELTPEQQAAEDAKTPEQKAADEKKGPNKPSLKKRLGELVRERHEADTREAAATRRAEAAEARAREAEEAAARGEKPKPKAAATPAPENEAAKPKPEDYEFGEYDPKYQDAMVEYRVEQSIAKLAAKNQAAQQEQAQRTAEAERTARWGNVIEKGAAKNPDFEAKVLKSTADWKLSKQMWEMAVDSEVGDDVLYALASDPAESRRIFDLPLVRQAAEFGKLEARFVQPKPGEGESTAKDGAAGHLPKAPKPQTRVRGAGGQYKTDAGTKDFAAFEAMMRAEDAARAKAQSV